MIKGWVGTRLPNQDALQIKKKGINTYPDTPRDIEESQFRGTIYLLCTPDSLEKGSGWMIR